MKHRQLTNPVVTEVERSAISPTYLDFPIKPPPATARHHFQFVDYIGSYNDPVDVQVVMDLLKENKYNELPEPFGLKPNTSLHHAYTMNVNIQERDDSTYDIVKWIMFEQRQPTIKVKDILIFGELYVPEFVGPHAVFHVKKLMHYVFEHLPGTSAMYWQWEPERATIKRGDSAPDFDANKRKEGWAFIQKCGPKANGQNQFRIWAEEQGFVMCDCVL